MQNNLYQRILGIQRDFNANKYSGLQTIIKIHSLQPLSLSKHINLDNYLYREGIFNKPSALRILESQIHKYSNFPNKVTPYKKEFNNIQNSHQLWFENYAQHQGSHNLISANIASWKVRSLLNCILCDIYVGSASEDSETNLMKRE